MLVRGAFGQLWAGWAGQHPLMTSDNRVGRGFKIGPKIRLYRLGQGSQVGGQKMAKKRWTSVIDVPQFRVHEFPEFIFGVVFSLD